MRIEVGSANLPRTVNLQVEKLLKAHQCHSTHELLTKAKAAEQRLEQYYEMQGATMHCSSLAMISSSRGVHDEDMRTLCMGRSCMSMRLLWQWPSAHIGMGLQD